jgi:predicted Fe-Mo cluster-binding NifX family protein
MARNMAKKTSEKKCKMAVTSLGGGIDGKIGSLARCTHLIIFEDSLKNHKVVKCSVKGSANEKGPNVAQYLTKLSVDIVITSTIGPRAFSILREAGISVKAGCKGKVSEAAMKCAAGKLKECKGATYAGNIEL